MSPFWLIVGCLVSCLAAVSAIGRCGPLPVQMLPWLLGYLALLPWWARQMSSHDRSAVHDEAKAAVPTFRLALLTLLQGLLWGVPSLVHGAYLCQQGLETYSWVLSTTVVFVSAAMIVVPSVVHLFAAGALLPLLCAWLFQEHEAGRFTFVLVILVSWVACGLVNLRGMQLSRQTFALARHRREREAELRERNRLLTEANQSRTRTLTTASHEIRQPVHALGLLVEQLRIDPRFWQVRGQVDEIAAVVHSLSSALEMLLDISRLDANNVSISVSDFYLNGLLERIVKEQGPAARRKGLGLAREEGADMLAHTDALLLHAIVSNFVTNAIRYTDRGVVKIASARRNETEAWVHVIDTGRGIHESHHQEIFGEYFRIDRENEASQGFGLGLAIVRRSAKLLGVDVEVQSQPGKGSRFSVSVPLSVEREPVLTKLVEPVAHAASVSRSLVGLKGFLVDNDQIVLKGMEGMVRSWGCRPVVANNVADLEAKLELLDDDGFGFIIADYHLGAGKPNGLDAIALVRKRSAHFVAASLLTGDLKVRAGSLDATEINVLHKPLIPAKLRAAIERMAADYRARLPNEPPQDAGA